MRVTLVLALHAPCIYTFCAKTCIKNDFHISTSATLTFELVTSKLLCQSLLGLQINWSKTKILQVPSSICSSTVQVADRHVEVVDAFIYLGCMSNSSGGSRGEVLRRIGIARSCMNMLDRRIWNSGIRLETKLCLYHTYIVPVLMYGCETWATTKYLLSRLDAFDTWALCKILRIPYTRHVSNAEVRRTTGCSLLSHLVTNRRLRLFSHIAHSSSHEDHQWALAAAIRQVPPDWKRQIGRPSHTWLHAIEADLGPLNFGLAIPWRKATTRDEWRHTVNIAMLQRSMLWKKKEVTTNVHNLSTKFEHCMVFCFQVNGEDRTDRQIKR